MEICSIHPWSKEQTNKKSQMINSSQWQMWQIWQIVANMTNGRLGWFKGPEYFKGSLHIGCYSILKAKLFWGKIRREKMLNDEWKVVSQYSQEWLSSFSILCRLGNGIHLSFPLKSIHLKFSFGVNYNLQRNIVSEPATLLLLWAVTQNHNAMCTKIPPGLHQGCIFLENFGNTIHK